MADTLHHLIGNDSKPLHVPVLLRETMELLSPQPGETVIDCTAGLGGHAAAMGERVGHAGTVVLFDLDAANLEASAKRVRGLKDPPRVVERHGSFAEVGRVMKSDVGWGSPQRLSEMADGGCSESGTNPTSHSAHPTPASVLLADLGFASPQVDDPARGFSFMREGPLDMRLDPGAPISAGELVNTMPETELMEMIRDLGEEPQNVARRIAAKVVQERAAGPILTTIRLAEIVRAAMPAALVAGSRIHPATRTFQALRIAVNDEIGSLERLLDSVGRAAAMLAAGKETWLARGARIGIISFHSLEDRPVKQKFAELVERGLAEHLTKKPVSAGEDEVRANPRSRSAKLRVIRLAR